MKGFLFSILALGLTRVLAAPAPPENEVKTRSPCHLLCKPGYTAVSNLATLKCKCVPNNEATCLRDTICITLDHPVWNPATKTCTCERYDFEDPDKERCLLATSCLEGSHAFWNSATKKCSCNRNDGEVICKTATTCSPGSIPKWHPETETCICEKAKKREDPPDPKTCPTIRCMSGTRPKWVPILRHCICEKIPEPDPPCLTIKCSAGYKAAYNPKMKSCFCQVDPTQCVGWVCIAEQQPVYDPITGKCGCQWIPGLEPGAPTSSRSVEEESAPVEERAPIAYPGCPGIYCIAEKHPVYDPATKSCRCEWIPGLGPDTAAALEAEKPAPSPYDPLNCYLLKIYCEGGDHHSHYDPKTKSCKCPPVKPS